MKSFLIPQDWGEGGGSPEIRVGKVKGGHHEVKTVPDLRVRKKSKEKFTPVVGEEKRMSLITNTLVTTGHHIFSQNTLPLLERRGGVKQLDLDPDVELPLSTVDHALVHYATWKETGLEQERIAYRSQRGMIKNTEELKLLDNMTEDKELIKLWGDPVEVARRTKNVHFM